MLGIFADFFPSKHWVFARSLSFFFSKIRKECDSLKEGEKSVLDNQLKNNERPET